MYDKSVYAEYTDRQDVQKSKVSWSWIDKHVKPIWR